MGGNYEIRKFIQISGDNFKYDKTDALIDIYLQRKGCIHLGIKFREPREKKYGWKVDGFQCKIMELEMIQEGIYAQKWKKYKFDFAKEVKIKVRKCHKKSESSDSVDSDHEFCEQKLRKKVLKLYDEVCKVLKHSQMKKNPYVSQWCEYNEKEKEQINNLQLFLVTKMKQKSQGRQLGRIKVQRLTKGQKDGLYFETECFQGNKKSMIVEKIKEWKGVNVSYPRLLSSMLGGDMKGQVFLMGMKPNI